MSKVETDILIVGGGTGGCAAAMAATALGCRVIMTELTDWIGGQLTSQAVPPDEHRWIEQFGCTRRYRRFRDGVRQYYRQHYPLTRAARAASFLNPGGGYVSALCHEPRVALAVLEQMLAWPRTRGQLEIRCQYKPVTVEMEGDRVRAVTMQHIPSGDTTTIQATMVLDATELGDLLPLAGVEYVTGAESQADTSEPHAVAGPAQPDNNQALTWCFPIAYDPDREHLINRPEQYSYWQQYIPQVVPRWPGRLLSWTTSHYQTLKPRQFVLLGHESETEASLWDYRQIVSNCVLDGPCHDVTLVNWPQNDYLLGSIIDNPQDEIDHHLYQARQLSLCLLYWMQTKAPRADGGQGYPGLYLRPELVGTEDGLAKFPYIRESRRIRAVFTVTENHIGTEARKGRPADIFADSVGIGCYRIDLHPSTGGNNYIDISAQPFQIPLGALLPQRVNNLLPACKNIGTTHITNGCYRLHPVEWNIGEAAGFLAAFALQRRVPPHAVHERGDLLADFQQLLRSEGIELAWPQIGPV